MKGSAETFKNVRDRGFVYLIVLAVLSMIMIMLAMLVTTTARDMKTTDLYGDGIRAYYIAQSGITKGLAYVRLEPDASKAENHENNLFFSDYPNQHSLK